MNPFFVTGLPRSRSAWISNWLTTDQSICHHDRPFEKWIAEGPRRTGFAGPELITQANEIAEAFPSAPWLIVVRNSEQSLESFKRWAGDRVTAEDKDLRWLWHRRQVDLAILSGRSNTETIRFEHDLDNVLIAQRVWAHLLPGIDFDVERWELLTKLNVQQDLKKGALWHSEQLQPSLR